jgi:hypothetical protein
MRLKLPKNLPIQVRELITMDFTRANPCPPPGVPLRELTPQELAALTPQELAAAGLSLPSSLTTEPATSNPQPASKETNATGRESNGRFAKHNRGGPGNPFARQVAAFRACVINSVTEDDLKEIVYALLEEAKDGNVHASKLLFSYLLGAPKPVVEPDELDLQEMRLAHQTALAAKTLQEATSTDPAADDDVPPLDPSVGRFTAGDFEAPPPAFAPSTNDTEREPCLPIVSEAPSPNRPADVCETGKPSQPPSPNRPNGEPAARVRKTRPSANGPNRARAPSPVGGASPGGQAVEVDEEQT